MQPTVKDDRYDKNQKIYTSQDVEKKERKKLFYIIPAFLVLLYLTVNFVVSPFAVDGVSMQPTFHTGDIVLVWRLPQTWASITNTEYIPSRSNVIILNKTAVSGEVLIKRVIGLPADHIVIGNNKLTVYNSTFTAGFNPDNAAYGKNLLPPLGNYDETVAAGQVFAMGDNRNPGASIDSRSNIGAVSTKIIAGKVLLRIYPFNKITLF
jgi:signal peptidase I